MKLYELYGGLPHPTSLPKPISFSQTYDVIVCGLGTAGSIAAITSAEKGLSVLGIEQFSCMGGSTTIGGVDGHYFGISGGAHTVIDEEISDFHRWHTCNKLESRKTILETRLVNAGADILYESTICGVYREGRNVVGVKICTPNGLQSYGCRILMDCTGDAHAAIIANCATEFGRSWDGLAQPYSMVSLVYDGNHYRTTNFDYGRIDQIDAFALSNALIHSRAFPLTYAEPDTQLVAHMPLLGLREGPRIVAHETVRLEDVFAGKQTATPAFFSYADLDKHGWDIAFDGTTLGDWSIGANLGAYNITVAVPWKVIIPKDVDGILVPCRGLGVDRDISSCVRMVLDMKKLGEVAGEIAYLSKTQNCLPQDIPYTELKQKLLASGCLDFSKNYGVCIDGLRDAQGNMLPKETVNFYHSEGQLEARFATLQPGLAIWSCRLMGSKALPALKALIHSTDENTRKHAAYALACIGSDAGIDILRQMVIHRDACMLQDCRKHNNQRGNMAIYWLGRLADEGIIDTLITIITDEQEIENPAYHQPFSKQTRYEVPGFRSEYFQFVSNAVAALIRIGHKHVHLRKKIAEAFYSAFEDENFLNRFITKNGLDNESSMVCNLKSVACRAAAHWEY